MDILNQQKGYFSTVLIFGSNFFIFSGFILILVLV